MRYFITDDGVIHTLFNNGVSTYTRWDRHKKAAVEEKPDYIQVNILERDGEGWFVAEEYVLHQSLKVLAEIIEGG
jgi:hypothetical protein